MARVDISILREIVRVVEARTKVPEFVEVNKRRFQVTYLEDHKQRIEEALRRHDRDRLNMLFGQLESKVKYQAVRARGAASSAKKAAASPAKRKAAAGAKKTATKKVAAKQAKPARGRPTPAKKKAAAKTATPRAARSPAKKKK